MATAYEKLLGRLKPGQTVYVPGATGEIPGLAPALAANPERAAGLHFTGCFVPGMNDRDYAGLHPDASLTTFMLPRAMRESFRQGRVRLLPLPYHAAARHLSSLHYDLAILHIAPPDRDGSSSFGIAHDFGAIVARRAREVALVINHGMPAMRMGTRCRIDQAVVTVEIDEPPISCSPAVISPELDRIGRRVADLVPDHAYVQTGIGGAPEAVWGHLRSHRGLRLRSGLASDGFQRLADAGALADEGHVAGIIWGDRALHRSMAENDGIAFADVSTTHDVAALALLPQFFAINSAIEIDLFGAVNVEWVAGRLEGGVGGAIDFMRAATSSSGGRSIVALPSTAHGGTVSRIVPRLSAPFTGIARGDVDIIVTEHGVAHLRRASLDERAEALIAIADPAYQHDLERAWARLRADF